MTKNLSDQIKSMVGQLLESEISDSLIQLQQTRKDFEGDITLVVFPLVKQFRKSPEQTAQLLGENIVEKIEFVEKFNVVKGFLNLSFINEYWVQRFQIQSGDANWGEAIANSSGKTVLVEYSSPNTNKPLHLGHLRNNFLGYSVSNILEANGHEVKKVQIINDRGIHICKSMVAWQKYGNNETPESTGIKGDKLIGKYYVKFDQVYKEQIKELEASGQTEKEAKSQAPIFKEAQQMLLKWEAKDTDVYSLWEKMNDWVYKGFDQTYKTMGVDFDKLYYESETYLLGKDVIADGIKQGKFYAKDDGSVWIDLTSKGLDEKLLLRSDGTAVYMTQDIGTAILRKQDFPKLKQLIYTVGNEQDYHFKVLFLILAELGYDFAKNCFHLSYGMVDLPSGKMKSREGNVVDADDLMEDMFATAKAKSEELGKVEGLSQQEQDDLFRQIGLSALKYFILKVDPKKKMLFNPEESIDFTGNTGPFIQYTFARIQALLRRGNIQDTSLAHDLLLDIEEKNLIKKIDLYPSIIGEAGKEFSPAIVANYIYDLVKEYNHFYQNIQIFGTDKENFRLQLSQKAGLVVKSGMNLLGIEVPNKM
jgi:arginyl-tRNA synthetase